MKCVQDVRDNSVKRLSEDRAKELVDLNTYYKYCPKSEWKKLRVAPVVAIVHTEDQLREIARKVDKKKHSQAKRDYRKA